MFLYVDEKRRLKTYGWAGLKREKGEKAKSRFRRHTKGTFILKN